MAKLLFSGSSHKEKYEHEAKGIAHGERHSTGGRSHGEAIKHLIGSKLDNAKSRALHAKSGKKVKDKSKTSYFHDPEWHEKYGMGS